MAKKNRNPSPLWGEESSTPEEKLVLADNKVAPSAEREQRKLRRLHKVYFPVAAAMAVAVMLATVASLTREEVTFPDPQTSVDILESRGGSAARIALDDWMASTPSPLPGGSVLSWDGFDYIEGAKGDSGSQSRVDDAELHRFTVAATSGDTVLYFDASVLVSVSDTLGARVSGTPTLIPRAPSATDGWAAGAWAGYETYTPTAPVSETVDAWSRAFTGTSSDLRLNVGDSNGDHAYIPLSGATVVRVSIVAGGVKPSREEGPPSDVLLRVELAVSWTGSEPAKGETSVPTSTFTYDLLVTGAETGAPRVVAWGAPGTGPDLEPFGNAVTGTVAALVPEDNETPAPTPEAEEDTDE